MLNAIRAEEEEKIAVALGKRQQDKERHHKEIQKLHEQSEELRRWVPRSREGCFTFGFCFPVVLVRGDVSCHLGFNWGGSTAPLHVIALIFPALVDGGLARFVAENIALAFCCPRD